MTETTTTAPARKPAPKKSNGKPEKPTVTLNFSDSKYTEVYEALKAKAEADDRSLTTFILRLLKQHHEQSTAQKA